MEYVQGKELKEFMESQSNKMKTNIKMRVTPEQSRKVQEICFEKGILLGARKTIRHLNIPFLFIDNNITGTDNKSFYQKDGSEEVDADLFIRTNGTCKEEDFYEAELYKPFDENNILEQKLKKKNEILKKARIKRKNQREELNKLNIKLQKCISLEQHDLKMKTVLNEKHKLELENIEMGRLVNLNKSALDLAVITKELAMNEIERKNNEIEKLKAVIEYLESKVK